MKNSENTITKKLNLIFGKIDFKSTPKMGGIKELTCRGVSVTENTTELYSGRGAKYNKNINHSYEEITITQKAMNDMVREVKLALKNSRIKIKQQQAIELKNKCDGFYAELKDNEVTIYNVTDFNLSKIAEKLAELSGVKVLFDHVKHNYEGWKMDFKTYTNVQDTHRLYASCGCNEFTLRLDNVKTKSQWI